MRKQSISYRMYVLSIGMVGVCDICGYYTWKHGVILECEDGIIRCARCRGDLYSNLRHRMEGKPLSRRIKEYE